MKKIFLYPFWLRLWHWVNAALFLVLIVSGISLQYSNSSSLLMPFQLAMQIHNIAGISLTLMYAFYAINNIRSRNYRHYIPKLQGAFFDIKVQLKYYLYGVFTGADHPFETTEKNKFNPLQRITYFGIMFFMVPLILITGWALMFPELAPEQIFGMGGVWPMALLHIIIGFALSMFFFGHIYLATHGETPTANFKSMINGWHVHHDHGHKEDPSEHHESGINE